MSAAGVIVSCAILDAASIAELVSCSRLMNAAMDGLPQCFQDEHIGGLVEMDDRLLEYLAQRVPGSAEDFAHKAAYLLARQSAKDMSADVADLVVEALEADAAARLLRQDHHQVRDGMLLQAAGGTAS
ncbi:MAG: hypothetical protein JWR10_2445 [Rubritepida sp.]|nr:hypothetical protein [Rubritepida sp.]